MIKTVTTTRLCRKCKIDKPLQEYYTDSRVKKDGRRSVCRACLTNGRPGGPVPMNPLTRYKLDDRGCWIWQGPVQKNNYGTIKWKGKATVAHRVIYELTKGAIEKGLVVDHLCSVKLCVNPEHLETVTPSVNTQRAWDRNHCATCTCKAKENNK